MRSSDSDTTLLYVALFARCRQITVARRGGTGPPLSNACSSALPGSIISIEAIRQPSPTSRSRRKIAATALNSSLDSGSSG